MAKRQQGKSKVSNRNIMAAAIILTLVVAGALLVAGWARLNEAANQSSIVAVRELIIRAAKETKTDAVIEPRTGDIYFPQARLYLPSQPSSVKLAYAYDPAGENSEELSVSDRAVFEQAVVPLYSARNQDELFAAVPKLQSCQRGITLSYDKTAAPENNQSGLQQTVQLSSGRQLYMYAETDCPELADTINVLKNIQAY